MSEDSQHEAQSGYRKVDRRHTSDQADADAPGAHRSTEGVGDEQPAQADVDVYDLLRLCIGMFVEQAWVKMGVQAAPGSSELRADRAQARAAIETVRAMVAQLEPAADEAERRQMQTIISNLQINFVQRG